MGISSHSYTANKADRVSHLVLVADSDGYFNDKTTVASVVDTDATNPKMTALKPKLLGAKGRRLLVRYKVDKPKGVRGGGDVETGGITITLANPPATAVVAVTYVDDDGTP